MRLSNEEAEEVFLEHLQGSLQETDSVGGMNTATQSRPHAEFSLIKRLWGSELIFSVVFFLRIQHHFHTERETKAALKDFFGGAGGLFTLRLGSLVGG